MPLSSEEYARQQKLHEDRKNGIAKKVSTRRDGKKKKAESRGSIDLLNTPNTPGREVLERPTASAHLCCYQYEDVILRLTTEPAGYTGGNAFRIQKHERNCSEAHQKNSPANISQGQYRTQ